jgi:para-nitrobenzyl esterase
MSDHLNQNDWAWSEADRKLADTMATYWTNFAKTGDPNGADLPHWPAFTARDDKVLFLGDPISVGGVADRRTLEVFDAVYGQVRGAAVP